MTEAPEGATRLGDVAHARSGDKGNHANIGVVANRMEDYAAIAAALTAERVARFFSLPVESVERFELPRIGALNFLLHHALEGGASGSLRADTQGKLLGTAILEITW